MKNIPNLVIPQQEIKQVVDAEKQVFITLDGMRITRKEAKKLIGPIKYWQTMRRLELLHKPAPAGSHILISAIGHHGGRTFNCCMGNKRFQEVCAKLYAAGAVYINAIHR